MTISGVSNNVSDSSNVDEDINQIGWDVSQLGGLGPGPLAEPGTGMIYSYGDNVSSNIAYAMPTLQNLTSNLQDLQRIDLGDDSLESLITESLSFVSDMEYSTSQPQLVQFYNDLNASTDQLEQAQLTPVSTTPGEQLNFGPAGFERGRGIQVPFGTPIAAAPGVQIDPGPAGLGIFNR